MKLNPVSIIVPLIFSGTWVGMSLLGQNAPPLPPNFLYPSNGNAIVVTQWINPPYVWTIFTNSMVFTNSSIAHPERKHKVIGYRKECPECGVSLTSTNITSWLVTEETNSVKMISVSFECLGCDETYVETFRKPIRKTKVEEITVEVVK